MNILLGILRWLCAIIISIALSTWIVVATINMTVTNRTVVKQWLASSGVYDTALSSLLRVDPTTSSTSAGTIISNSDMQKALAQTFNAEYLKTSTNTIIDATYDWMEGKTKAVTFSIPVQDLSSNFTNNLTAIIEPKLAALPACTGKATYPSCLPAGISAAEYAKQVTKPSNSSPFLGEPFTQNSFGDSAPSLPWLPYAWQAAQFLFIALPVVIIIAIGIYVSASKDKLLGLLHNGRQITISSAVFLIVGVTMWLAGGAINLAANTAGMDASQAAMLTGFANPLVRAIITGCGSALTIASGGAMLVGVALWVGAFVWRRKRDSRATKQVTPTAAPKDPQTPDQSSTPEQTAPPTGAKPV